MSRRVDDIAVTAPQPTAPPATAYKPFNFASASTAPRLHSVASTTTTPRPAQCPHPATGHRSAGAGGAGDIMDDADMIPTSPSADSSPSSSDLDTESTGSFFPDRSTTLGTLMGVSAFGERRAAARTPAAGETAEGAQRAVDREEARSGVGVWRRRRSRRRLRGRGRSLGGSWWRLCRDHGDGGPPTSLGEFLDMERQLAGADFLCDGTGGSSGRETATAAAAVAGTTALFEDGRVRPPQPQQQAAAAAEERGRWRLLRASEGSTTTTSSSTTTTSSSLARLPVLLTGICSGGAG